MNDDTEKNSDWWKGEEPPPNDLWAEAGLPQPPLPAPVSGSQASESDEGGDDAPEPPWWKQKGLPYDPSPNSVEGKAHLVDEEYRQKWVALYRYRKRLFEAVDEVIPPGVLRVAVRAALVAASKFDTLVEVIRKGRGALHLATAVKEAVDDGAIFGRIIALTLPDDGQED